MLILPDYPEFKENFRQGRNQVVYSSLTADLDTPVSIMLKLAQAQRNSFLLESVTGGDVRGRYSIVGMEPDIMWECKDSRVTVSRIADDGRVAASETDIHPFESLRELIAQSQIDLPAHLPRNSAGLFGYLGYDMIRFVEELPDVNIDILGTPDALLLRPTVVAILDGVKGEVTIVSPAWAEQSRSAEEIYEHARGRVMQAILRLRDHTEGEHDILQAGQTLGQLHSEVSRDDYLEMVVKAKEYIRQGDIFQVVPSQRWWLDFSLPPFSFYRALRRTNPSPFMFFFNFGEFQVVGASPEILVRVFDREITIRPLAGTRPRGNSVEEDRKLALELLADEKECAEHLMLLDLGRNDVGRVSRIGSVRPTEQFAIEKYSHVMHIVSNVVGELAEEHDSLSALLAGLPAGTVSGAPKVRAMEIIDELERSKRGVYAGGVGYLSSSGDMDMCIALRTAVLKDGQLYLQAGAGIVHDSDPETEWEETVSKREALLKAAEEASLFVRSD